MAAHYKQQQRNILIAYIMLFFTAITILPSILAYALANYVSGQDPVETWLLTHAMWIKRQIVIFLVMVSFAGLWLLPLFAFAWNANLLVTGTTVIGGVFACIAWLFLLNSFLKGMSSYFKRKAVY